MASSKTPASPWMFGPAVDLLLGCGLGYALLVGGLALLPVSRDGIHRWGVLATLVIGMPHYGATLVRVYENRADRRKYAFFTVWASLLIWLFFVGSVYDALLGSLLVTLYVNWSPWHYAGQNYGLAVMFLRRRGISMTRAVKRPLYGSFILSYVLVFLSLNGGYEAAGYVPVDLERASYRLLTLQIPQPVYRILFAAVLAAYAAALAITGWQLSRLARMRAALPAVLLIATQAVWFSIPSIALWLSGARLRDEYVVFFFLWVGIAHSAQYLWITTYYAAASEPARGRLLYLGKTLLAGGLVFTLPALLFAPALLGTVPYEVGLWLLIASAVNLQHFVLDGAIWKLRDGPVARILLASPDASATEGQASRGAAGLWTKRAVWSVGAVCTFIAIGAAWEYDRGWIAATERNDPARASLAESRLASIGRDNPSFYQRRAELYVQRGDPAAAIEEYRKSLALYPTADTWYALGVLRARQGDTSGAMQAFEASLEIGPTAEAWTGIGALRDSRGETQLAAAAFERALEIDRNFVPALHLAGLLWLERGQKLRALDLLARAAALAPDDARLQADVRRAGG